MPRKKAGWNAYAFWIVLGIWLSSSLYAAAIYAADKIYKTTDEYGATLYSNVAPGPDAEEVDVPQLSIIPPPEYDEESMQDPMRPPLELAQDTSQETRKTRSGNIYKLDIVQPENNQTVPIAGSTVQVELDMQPPLDVTAGHRIEIVVDGVVSKETRDTRVSLPGLDRGAHQVMARIVNDTDDVVQSTRTVNFYAQQEVVSPNSTVR
jgi:hypothetical protein